MTNKPGDRPFDRPPEAETRVKTLTALTKALIVTLNESSPGFAQTVFDRANDQTDDHAVTDDLMHIWTTMRIADNGD